MCKKALVLFFAFLFSIESFAAVVSDNDGSAFITKAEYDSLKNDFQAQIDSYNNNIDNKIDAAIAGYIAGIKVDKQVERPILVNATEWMMWTSDDYPKYAEGKPYIHGTVSNGHANKGNDENLTWIALIYHGKSDYKSNGEFKKHFINKPGTNYKNGNNVTINGGEYDGYYINEGEDILVSGWSASLADNWWALEGEKYEIFTEDNLFENTELEAQGTTLYDDHIMGRPDNGWSTGLAVVAQMATRITGLKTFGNNISIFDEINDNRFFDKNGANRVGITATNPAIKQKDANSEFISWWDDVAGSRELVYASLRLRGTNGTAGPWTTTDGNGAWSYTDVSMSNIYSGATRANKIQSYLKMANIAYDIQFENLWSALLDSAAYTTTDFYIKNATRAEVINNLKKAIIVDSNNINHLSLKAGFPFLNVENGEKVQWTIKNNTNSTVYIYGKYGPYSLDSVTPLNESEIEWTNGKETDKRIFEISANGTATLKFDVLEDGIVFLKWATADNKNAILDISKNPIVQLKEE